MIVKRKLFYALLGAEAAFCLLLVYLQNCFSGWFSTAIAFPFQPIGAGLRTLSLSGDAGNAAAILVYLAVSLIPTAVFLLLKRGGRDCKVDLLLPVLSILLFVTLYFMVNPGLFPLPLLGDLLGGTFYSVLCGYLVLRVLDRWKRADTGQLFHGLDVLLHLMIVLFVFVIFSSCFGSLPETIRSVQQSNQADSLSGMDPRLPLTCGFLILGSAVSALPYAMDILITFSAIRLMEPLRADRYSDEAVAAAERLSKRCVRALSVSVLANIGFHLLQLLLSRQLLSTSVEINVPLFSIAFVFGVLLLARYVRENQQLKRDNDLFI